MGKKYSIIIPTLNEEKLLPDLLKTLNIYKNKYNYEIIVSDGGSNDKTIEIAKQFCDKIIVPINGERINISASRMKGALISEGENIIFINADVKINIDEILSIAENKFINSNYVAMTYKTKVDKKKEKISDKIFNLFINYYVIILNIIGIGMMRGEFQLIRKEIYNKAGGYNPNIYTGEDFELSTRIRKEGKILFIKESVVYESPRRYNAWGYLKTLMFWFVNAVSSWLLKKSFKKNWEPIR